MAANTPLAIELRRYRTPGRSLSSIDAWMEADPRELTELMLDGTIDLSQIDPRLQGHAFIPRFSLGDTRVELKTSGEIAVDGRTLEDGDRVRIIRGGEILWRR